MESQKLFKCLKYVSSDALSQDDLTEDEILLITNQEDNTDETRVLFSPFNLKVEDVARTEMRIYVRKFNSEDLLHLTNVELSIQVITHNTLCRLENGQQRLLVMVSEVLRILNGTDIGFVGDLLFLKPITIGQYTPSFVGYELLPTTRST